MSDPWSKPSEVKGTRFYDFVGDLLLIEPTEYETGLVGKFTRKGDTYDQVVADVTVIDVKHPEDSVTHKGLYITQGRVIGKTKENIGGMVLAKLYRPEKVSEDDNPAYELIDPSDEEAAAARKFLSGLASRAGDTPKAPVQEPPF